MHAKTHAPTRQIDLHPAIQTRIQGDTRLNALNQNQAMDNINKPTHNNKHTQLSDTLASLYTLFAALAMHIVSFLAFQAQKYTMLCTRMPRS